MSTTRYAIKIPFPDDDAWCFITKPAPSAIDYEEHGPVVQTFATEQEAMEYARKEGWGSMSMIVPIHNENWY